MLCLKLVSAKLGFRFVTSKFFGTYFSGALQNSNTA